MFIPISESSRDSFFTLLEETAVGAVGAVGDAAGVTAADDVTVGLLSSTRLAVGEAVDADGSCDACCGATFVGSRGISCEASREASAAVAAGVDGISRVTGGGEVVGMGLVEGMAEKSESVDALVLVDEKIDDVSEEKSSPEADEFAVSVVEIEVTASLEPIDAPDGAW